MYVLSVTTKQEYLLYVFMQHNNILTSGSIHYDALFSLTGVGTEFGQVPQDVKRPQQLCVLL